MILFTAFEAHFSKIMGKIYGNRNFQCSTRGKRSLQPFSSKILTGRGHICCLQNEGFLP